jgi:hypothetical protein
VDELLKLLVSPEKEKLAESLDGVVIPARQGAME